MATAIQVKPGTDFPTVTLIALNSSGTEIVGNLVVTALKDITIDNAKDVFTWTQLDTAGKLQVPTTSTNSMKTNLVVDEALFFGSNAAGTSASELGLMGLSKAGTKCNFTTKLGSKTITGKCYVVGLSPTVSADSPVWVSPCTFTVTGDYTVA